MLLIICKCFLKSGLTCLVHIKLTTISSKEYRKCEDGITKSCGFAAMHSGVSGQVGLPRGQILWGTYNFV